MTKIEKALTLYREVIRTETIARTHRRLMIALPKKKVPKFERLLAVAVKDWMNAKAKFNGAAQKLKPTELLTLQEKIHER